MLSLMAVGASGQWNIQIDRESDFAGAWGITIEHSKLYIQATLGDLRILEHLRSLLQSPPAISGEVIVGTLAGASLSVLVSTKRIKFKIVRGDCAPASAYSEMLEISFDTSESRDLLHVLDEVCNDLKDA